MKRVLCTGGGGFIFSNFIRKALYNKSDYSFISIDLCKGPNVLNNIYANRGHKFHIGDIADKHIVNVIFELERPDIVIHGAA
ncbi:MAG TPA: NAD-dependent epimerase/dehydratase family protein, partial [Paenisporosarcina sp.]|nr:NAD-dependent epimerase/dehydratase family protein [Paenisporosarcina sp.]